MKNRNLLMLLLLPLLASCNNCSNECENVSYTSKHLNGITHYFSEPQGIYSKDPSILKTDNNEYVYYTTNEYLNYSEDIIGVREMFSDGTYSFRNLILKTSENGWDSKHVSNPDIIKGKFNYNGNQYAYLLAYQGNSKSTDKEYQIGFAVSNNPTKDFIKVGDAPIISYSSYENGSGYGVGSPSLVSYDEEGKLYLFYTYADSLITTTRVSYIDASDLNNIVISEASSLTSKGLKDKNSDVVFNNGDFAIDKDNNKIYVIRDRNPVLSAPATSDSIQIASASLDILTNPFDNSWELEVSSIDDLATADMEAEDDKMFGWERIFTGTLICDEYGYINNPTSFDIAFSVCNVREDLLDTSYTFSAGICKMNIEKGA